MKVFIRNIKTGLIDIENNVVKAIVIDDGKVQVMYDNNDSFLSVSTVFKDSVIEKVLEG